MKVLAYFTSVVLIFSVQAFAESPADPEFKFAFKLPSQPEPRVLQEPTVKQQAVYGVLRVSVLHQIGKDPLGALHAISNHEVYRNYLSETYGVKETVETFEGFYDKQGQPPPERYLNYFQDHFGVKTVEEMTEEDIRVLWSLDKALWRHLIQKKFYDKEVMSPLISILTQETFMHWAKKRGILGESNPIDIQKIMSLNMYLVPQMLVEATWVHEVIKKYGKADGLLWLAIQDPFLFGKCLANFTDAETLFLWIQRSKKLKKEDSEDES